MTNGSNPARWWKRFAVAFVGRERANKLTAPYHDWTAGRRTRLFLAGLPSRDLCINIGCGSARLAEWVNLDAARAEGVDVVWDVTKGLPFQSASCSAIFGEHIIEHIAKEEVEELLKDCHRVLQPGGVLRLSTPDAELYLRSYAGDREFLRREDFLEPAEAPLDRINIIMRAYGHRWLYDGETLTLALQRAGFSKIVRQRYGESLHPRMKDIDLELRAFESLYIEAVK